MYDVITIGSSGRDVFLKSAEYKVMEDEKFRTGKAGCFTLGTKIYVDDVAFTSGGGGTNTGVGFSRQGFKTASIFRVGDDEVGKAIINEMKSEGVETLAQLDKERDTAYSTILVSEFGDRTILAYRGANDYLNENEIDWDNLKSTWLYIDSLAGRKELLGALLDWAVKNQVKVAFNPGKKMVKLGAELHPYLDKIDIFSVNESEAAYIAGIDYSQDKEPEIFDKLDDVVKGIVIMSKGARGVEVSDGEVRYSAGVPDSPVIDRTGAGDAFGSGFVSGYIHGGDIYPEQSRRIKYAIQLGTANGTEVVRCFGAKKGLLKKDEWGDYPKVEVKEQKI